MLYYYIEMIMGKDHFEFEHSEFVVIKAVPEFNFNCFHIQISQLHNASEFKPQKAGF